MPKKKNTVTSANDYEYLKTSSAQDCTGLIPSGIQSEEELENYEELYPFLPKACADINKNEDQ